MKPRRALAAGPVGRSGDAANRGRRAAEADLGDEAAGPGGPTGEAAAERRGGGVDQREPEPGVVVVEVAGVVAAPEGLAGRADPRIDGLGRVVAQADQRGAPLAGPTSSRVATEPARA